MKKEPICITPENERRLLVRRSSDRGRAAMLAACKRVVNEASDNDRDNEISIGAIEDCQAAIKEAEGDS